jgi:hypothetical protein
MLDVKSLAVDFYLPSGKVTALKDISFTVSPARRSRSWENPGAESH